MSARETVLALPELFSQIFARYVHDPDPKVMLVRAFRILLVDSVFMRAAVAVISKVFKRCEKKMFGLHKSIDVFLGHAPNQNNYDAVIFNLEWAKRLYHVVNFTDASIPAAQARVHFEQLLMYRQPEGIDEMMHMLHGNCLCCGRQCILPECQQRAWMQHPYRGVVSLCHTDTQCGCYRYVLHGTWLPSTNPNELCEVAFACTEDEEYLATLRVDSHFTVTDKMFLKFLRAAKRHGWYGTNIARLFGMRPRRLFPCEHQPLRLRQNTHFVVNLPLFEPVVDLGKDASIAQIFGRTRKEMHALIRVGGRIMREEYQLDANFDAHTVRSNEI